MWQCSSHENYYTSGLSTELKLCRLIGGEFESGKLINLGFPRCKTIIMPLIFQSPVPLSLVFGVAFALHAKRCSLCSAVSCWHLLPRCSRWIWSRRSCSRGVSVENLPGRGFGAICCVCVSFACEIVHDSPMVNIIWQTMNKHNSLSKIIRENAPWSSAAKSTLPGNAKWSMTKHYMTSLADTKHILIDLWGIEFCSWLRPRAVSRPRARATRL